MLKITSNLDQFRGHVRSKVQGQVPFATAKALTRTAQDAKKNTEKRMRRVFDRPTPYTMRGVFTQSASKRRLIARVGIKDRQAEYLGIQEEGGTRRPKGRALVVPSEAKRNRYGNLSRNQVRRLRARPDTFSGRVGGVDGLWQRFHGQLHLLVVWAPAAKYRPRFGFEDGARKAVQARMPVNFERELRQALRTAR